MQPLTPPLPSSLPRLPDSDQTDSLFDQLQRAHAELDLALSAMVAATQAPSHDRSNYSTARWKLSSASQKRRSLVWRICQRLIPLVAPEDSATLSGLRQRDIEMLHHSAAHVGHWTLDAVERDWAGYCRATHKVRRSMIARIEEEKRLFFPILQKYPRIN